LNAKNKIDKILGTGKEEYNMCKALDDIYNDGLEQGIEKGIPILIESLREVGASDEVIKEKLKEKYCLKDDEIKIFMEKRMS